MLPEQQKETDKTWVRLNVLFAYLRKWTVGIQHIALIWGLKSLIIYLGSIYFNLNGGNMQMLGEYYNSN